jgi:transcriptional regulator with XRE-family HTH domain
MKSLSLSYQKKYISHLGANLRDICRSKGYSQAQLAIDTDMEVSQISRIERGILSTSVLTLLKIAVVLEVELSDLVPTHFSDDG